MQRWLRWAPLSLVAFVMSCAKSTVPPPSSPKSVASEPASQPIPADLRANVECSETLGVSIFLLDQAAARGSDALGGYLAVKEADDTGRPKPSFMVSFFTAEDSPRIAYRIHVSLEAGVKPTVDEIKPPAAASDGERLLIRARQTAIAALREIVQPINPVVLPRQAIGQEGVLVYLLAGTKRPRVAVLGKHYRVLVSADGRSVTRFEPLSKAVIEMEAEPGDTPVQINVSHILHDYPLETHVFASLLYRVPVGVVTARGLWIVDGAKIFFLGAQ
jgi:hypothetical protein